MEPTSNNRTAMTRRQVLQTMGGSLALPLLASTPGALLANSETKSLPRRLIYIYFPNGVADGSWFPQEVGDDGRIQKLNEWMSPLEPYRDQLIYPRGCTMSKGRGHVTGPPNWLTGLGYDEKRSLAHGISVDQVAAAALGNDTLLPSLELGLKGEGFFSNSLPRNSISWNASGTPLPREIEPSAVFNRMFPPPQGGATNRSVLDAVTDQAKRLSQEVSRQDQQKLDEYFESIRALERRIAFTEQRSSEATADRGLTDTRTRPAPGIPTEHEAYLRQMIDLMVLAFQSDATRVITLMFDHGQSNRYFDFIDGVKGTWHALSHYKNASGKTQDDDGTTSWASVEEKRDMYSEVGRWHHRQLAYLLERLQSIREPQGGTLLDTTLIVYGSSLGDGHRHGNNDLPTLVAGGSHLGVKPGRVIDNQGPIELSSLHLASLRAVGVATDRFGAAKRPLEALTQ